MQGVSMADISWFQRAMARAQKAAISEICCVAPIVSPVWPPSLRRMRREGEHRDAGGEQAADERQQAEAGQTRRAEKRQAETSATCIAPSPGWPAEAATPSGFAGGSRCQCQTMAPRLRRRQQGSQGGGKRRNTAGDGGKRGGPEGEGEDERDRAIGADAAVLHDDEACSRSCRRRCRRPCRQRPSSCSAPVMSVWTASAIRAAISGRRASQEERGRRAAGRAIRRPASGKGADGAAEPAVVTDEKSDCGMGMRLRKATARAVSSRIVLDVHSPRSPASARCGAFGVVDASPPPLRESPRKEADLQEKTSCRRISRTQGTAFMSVSRPAVRRFPHTAARPAGPGCPGAGGCARARRAADQAAGRARPARGDRLLARRLDGPGARRQPAAGGDLCRQSRRHQAGHHALSACGDAADGREFRSRRRGDQPDLRRL